MSLKWHVIRTEPKGESRVAASLISEGIDIYLPKINHIGGPSIPLFPGYLFVKCDLDSYGLLNSGLPQGILGWVRFGQEVPAIPEESMTELIEHVRGINSYNGIWHKFEVGEKAGFESGSFSGSAQILDEAKNPRGRVRVLLEFMGRFVNAQVPYAMLKPLSEVDQRLKGQHKLPRRTRGGGRRVKIDGPTALLGS